MYRESTVLAWCIFILGVFGIADGSDALIRGAIHAEGSSCKVICGLSLLLSQFFSPAVGALATGIIYLLLGVFLVCIGYLMLKGK
jgi:small neutral amino acid transporter SnatA (MarC family)